MAEDLKIYGINLAAMMINFMHIDLVLKVILTFVAIGYTLTKWYIMLENRKDKND